VLDLPRWTTKTLLGLGTKIFGHKDLNQPFSLGRLAHSARRVLVIPPAGLAEMLHVYPAITLLRKALPDSRIICLVQGGQDEVLRNQVPVDDMIEFPEFGGARALWEYRPFVSEVRDRMIEAAFYFDFRYDLYRVLLPFACGARSRMVLQGEIGFPLFNVEIVPGEESTYFRERNLSLVKFLTRSDETPGEWGLPEKERNIAREIVKFRKPNPSDLLIGVDLSHTKSGERPPFDVMIRLAKSFEALKPSRIALLSDPDPAIKEDEIRRLGTYDWLDIPRKSFRDTLGILSQCNLLICGNTNLFHFAVAMGIPAFALFSDQEDRRWVPTGGAVQLVEQVEWSATPPAKLAMKMRDFACAPSRN
jgi:ADP-heptose:LPS heptosyltransferase